MAADLAQSDFGAKLHRARESRGVSLSRIATATKIPIGVLQALERNDISRLPGGVIGRGFVRSFATEVGLDPEATVALFVAQFPTDSVTEGYPTSEGRAENEVVETRRLPPRIRLVLAGGMVFLVAFPAYFATRQRTVNHAVVQRTSDAAMAKAAPSEPATAPIVRTPPVPALVPAESAAAAVRSTEPLAPRTAPFAVSPDLIPEAAASSTEEKPAREKPTTQPAGRIFVLVSALRPSWVIATVDGQKAFSRLLEVGEEETLSGHNLVLTAGDAGAVVMTVNGAAARPLGREGETVTAYVNRTNLKKYLALR